MSLFFFSAKDMVALELLYVQGLVKCGMLHVPKAFLTFSS